MSPEILNTRAKALFLAFAAMLPRVASAVAEEQLRIELAKPEDSASEQRAGDSLSILISSKSGIGKCTLSRGVQPWPKALTVCLHLAGLEMFRVTSGDVVLAASVSSTPPFARRVARIKGKEELPLDAKDALWIGIEPLDKQHQPATKIPLDGGYFQITLPAALWKDNPDKIELEWIDFYRG